MIDFNLFLGVIVATLIAYLLGALPIAAWISRRSGIDIFSVGTGLPGASNVRRSVGNIPGGLVLIGDLAKGAVAIVAARQMQVEGLWLILPCFAMVIGPWRSIFTRLQGRRRACPSWRRDPCDVSAVQRLPRRVYRFYRDSWRTETAVHIAARPCCWHRGLALAEPILSLQPE